MKKLALFLLCWFCFVPSKLWAAEPIQVVTAHRILEDWVKQIGGEHVEVKSIHNNKRDIHYFEPRPSHIKMIAKADAVVIAGLDLDAWMPELLSASRNGKVQYGQPGCIDPSVGLQVLEKPAGKVDMSRGDIHPYGNPHFYFYKDDVLKALDNICDGLCRISPSLCKEFKANCERYKRQVAAKFDELTQRMSPHKGKPVVSYHASWNYFTYQFDMELIGMLEPKPGIPPSPSHLEKLVEEIQQKPGTVILAEPYYSKGPSESVAKRTGAKVIHPVVYLGTRDGDKDYLDFLEKNVKEIASALQ